MKALYRTGVNRKRHVPYLVAVADFMSAPVISNIDATAYTGGVGQEINVNASDDFQVTSLTVTIIDADGLLVERGEAVTSELHHDIWRYFTRTPNDRLMGSNITVEASDLGGNSTTLTIGIADQQLHG